MAQVPTFIATNNTRCRVELRVTAELTTIVALEPHGAVDFRPGDAVVRIVVSGVEC